jgi:hypothetical protein
MASFQEPDGPGGFLRHERLPRSFCSMPGSTASRCVGSRKFLAELGLDFLKFNVDPTVQQRYSMQYPGELARADLNCWTQFEVENPARFSACTTSTCRDVPGSPGVTHCIAKWRCFVVRGSGSCGWHMARGSWAVRVICARVGWGSVMIVRVVMWRCAWLMLPSVVSCVEVRLQVQPQPARH